MLNRFIEGLIRPKRQEKDSGKPDIVSLARNLDFKEVARIVGGEMTENSVFWQSRSDSRYAELIRDAIVSSDGVRNMYIDLGDGQLPIRVDNWGAVLKENGGLILVGPKEGVFNMITFSKKGVQKSSLTEAEYMNGTPDSSVINAKVFASVLEAERISLEAMAV